MTKLFFTESTDNFCINLIQKYSKMCDKKYQKDLNIDFEFCQTLGSQWWLHDYIHINVAQGTPIWRLPPDWPFGRLYCTTELPQKSATRHAIATNCTMYHKTFTVVLKYVSCVIKTSLKQERKKNWEYYYSIFTFSFM